ncbi:MAG: hypothetical protein LBC19_04300 [Tannerella sp.]|jgi:YD repeat-containing protein|nr:hypothetical protein [Tannerella sp.]
MKKLFLTLSVLLSAVFGLSAICVRQQGQAGRIYYAHRDHFGSILSLTDANGTVANEYSYDAWGRLRNPANQTAYTPGSEPELLLNLQCILGREDNSFLAISK